MMWLLILSLLFLCNVVQPILVFTFNGTSSISTATSSYAYLVNNLDLPDKFVLCTSVKQARFDDVGFYVISGRDSEEWLTTQLSTFSNEIWLTVWWDTSFSWAGKLQNPMLDIWYHICLKLDLEMSEIEANVNGRLIGTVHGKNITNKPDKLRIKVGLGHDNEQFQGSITNIKVLKGIPASNTLSTPCRQEQDDLLSWSPENWTLAGSQWTMIEEFEYQVCVSNDFYDLAISSKMTFYESLDICKHKLNNSAIPFDQDNDLFLKYVTWHMEITGVGCPYIWTPLIKLKSEGLMLDMNNNFETTVQNWARGQPNGGTYENFVQIKVAQKALADSPQDFPSCSSCRISNMLLLQLDGGCEHSLIGNIRKSNLDAKLILISDKKYKIVNTWPSIGFDGWKSILIRLSTC